MSENLSQSEVRTLMQGGYVAKKKQEKPMHIAKALRRVRGTMNKGESQYAAELESRLQRGEIRWYEFEAVKIRLADKTFLTPDFAVIAADGYLELHDVKGRKGKGYWCEEDAKIKLKVVAERFPARVKIVWPLKGGGWGEEVF